MECSPTVSAAVDNVATPPLTDEVPRVVEPSVNVTVPVGVPELFEVTVTVNVTGCPKTEGFEDEVIEVVVEKPERFSKTVIPLSPPTARSGLPSWLKSPTAMPQPGAPRVK